MLNMDNDFFFYCMTLASYCCIPGLKFLFLFNRKLCCSTIKSLFTNEGKHGGEVTVEAVRLIADYVKAYNCQLHPDSVDVRPTPSKVLSLV